VPDRVSKTAGIVLRRTRHERGLTLRDVQVLSAGYFKPSALGAYERGERGLTVARFCELAALYDVPAHRLLAEVTATLAGEDRTHVSLESDVITLPEGEVTQLASSSRTEPRTLLGKLQPAFREGSST
jgi:transcriptional regulator with XRE-family HTH domain